jgi:DNA repair exonuclease SbcCD ATPase subunit
MQIQLKKLSIRNFKGILSLDLSFGPETNIYGVNGSGKTTIADAWYFLLFGKNSSDDTKFNIKNTVLTDLNTNDHEVEGELIIDGETVILRRVYREKWTKKRGSELKVYEGNEQDLYWNGVPCQLREYQSKIATILPEKVFKLVTNPNHFNAIVWQDRRDQLIRMAGKVTLADVAGTDKEFLKLLEDIGKGTLEDHRKKLAARIAKLKEDILHLPARIDECKKLLPEEEPDFSALQTVIDITTEDLNTIDIQLNSKTAAQKKFQNEQSNIQAKIHALTREAADLKNKLRIELENADRNSKNDIDACKSRITSVEASLSQLEKDKKDGDARIASYDKQLEEGRTEWKAINAETFTYPEFVFDENETTCQHCKQPLPEADINQRRSDLEKNHQEAEERARTTFNNSKTRRLADNQSNGKKTAGLKVSMQDNVNQLIDAIAKKKKTLEEEKGKLASLEAQYVTPRPIEERLAEVVVNNNQLLSIQEAIQAQQALLKEEPEEDNAELKARKKELVDKLSVLNQQMGMRDTIENTRVRIENLMASEKNLNQQQASAEREMFILQKFEKARVEMMVSMVNGLFKYVTFKLFNYTIEGGEVPCCETMLDGVPFSDLNTAGKIKAGIDVINAFSKHYKVWAPIILDNRESVTVIPDTPSQVINLIVSPTDTKLRVESPQLEEAIA